MVSIQKIITVLVVVLLLSPAVTSAAGYECMRGDMECQKRKASEQEQQAEQQRLYQDKVAECATHTSPTYPNAQSTFNGTECACSASFGPDTSDPYKCVPLHEVCALRLGVGSYSFSSSYDKDLRKVCICPPGTSWNHEGTSCDRYAETVAVGAETVVTVAPPKVVSSPAPTLPAPNAKATASKKLTTSRTQATVQVSAPAKSDVLTASEPALALPAQQTKEPVKRQSWISRAAAFIVSLFR